MNDSVKKIKIDLNYSYLFIAKKNIFDDPYEKIKEVLFVDLKKIR